MTLHEAFDLLRPEHRPVSIESHLGGMYARTSDRDLFALPQDLAESAICWAMTKALWERGGVDFVPVKGGVFCVSTPRVYHYERPGEELPALVFVYADRFPKKKAARKQP